MNETFYKKIKASAIIYFLLIAPAAAQSQYTCLIEQENTSNKVTCTNFCEVQGKNYAADSGPNSPCGGGTCYPKFCCMCTK